MKSKISGGYFRNGSLLKRLLLVTSFSAVLLVVAVLLITEPVIAGTGSAPNPADQDPILPKTNTVNHPSLIELRSALSHGSEGQIVGVYAPGNFALPVIQQPSSNPGFVSADPEAITQFSLATEYGTIGFLAHNTLSGAHFFDLEVGQTIALLYGDGSVKRYIIREQRSFQALTPSSPYSRFRETNGSTDEISSTDLFNQIYTEEGQLIFQTCLASHGVDNWGRYFVIAIPADGLPHYNGSFLIARVP
jgi:hypothetical protein